MMLMPMTLVLALQDARDAHLSKPHFWPNIPPPPSQTLSDLFIGLSAESITPLPAAYLLFTLMPNSCHTQT